MSSLVNALVSSPRRVMVLVYCSAECCLVPRNIMCSKKCANPERPFSTSLRLPTRISV